MTNQTKLLKNLNEIKKYKEFFDFHPNIDSIDDIIKNRDSEIKITHKTCRHQTTDTLSKWIKKSAYRASRLKFFDSNDINLTCPQCCTEQLQRKTDLLYNKEFKIIGFFINTKTKIEIKHKDCIETFKVRYETLMSGKMRCKHCKKTNTPNKNSKEKWLLDKLKKSNIDDILPQESYKGYNEKMLFLHTKCNKTFSETPSNLFRRKNKCPHCNKDAFILNSSNKEFEKDRLEIMQKNMDKYHKNKFKILKINTNNKATVSIKCLICSNEFTDYRQKLYTDKLRCPHCNITKNKFISTKDKIISCNKKLNGKFEILERFTNQNDKIKLKRISCGHTIKRSLNEILNPNYKDVCPECNRLNRLDNMNHKLEMKYNGRFKNLNGLEKYQNIDSLLLFLDNECGNKFVSSFANILNNKYFKCPSCETEDMTASTKAQVYNKFKGEYLMISDYIDSKTPIRFKHTTCNHIFYKTKAQFLNSKIPCDECRKRARSLGIKKAQIKTNNKFGRLFVLKGIYVNNYSKLPIICNNCNTVEEISLNTLLNRTGCKTCKTQFL